MPVNFLEQLAAEWYEYQGYFVRRNVLVGKLRGGGHECELDVVAFHPGKRKLVHVEPSMDADSWEKRERRFRKKFDAGRRHIPSLFSGFEMPPVIDHVALLFYGSTKNHPTIGGGRTVLVSDFLIEILGTLKTLPVASNAISENLVVLRSFQFLSDIRRKIVPLWND